MSEIEALQNDSCPACGAKANWSPEQQALICPFCGTETPTELDRDTGKVREVPLAQALRDIGDDQRGWMTEKRSVRCQSCQAVMVFDPDRVGQNCDFCGSPAVVPYEEVKSPLRPLSILPFQVSETQVRESMRSWYASKWFAPGKLKTKGLLDTIKGYYLPYWTFDAEVDCHWQADAGFYEYSSERYRDGSGNWQTRQKRRVRWEPRHGFVEHFFDDEPVPATTGIHLGLLRKVEPFPTKDLVQYDQAYLSGFTVEHYQVVLIDASRQARESMNRQLRQMCVNQIPGDTYRNLRMEPNYFGETFKLILVPVWLLAYQYGAKTYQALANGYTGKIDGEYPKSWVKILFVVLLAIVAVIILALIANK